VGIRRAGMGGVGLGLVGSKDRLYRTPLVHFLHGHHYWPLYSLVFLYYGDGPIEGQKAAPLFFAHVPVRNLVHVPNIKMD
jgi:hypothetical protein